MKSITSNLLIAAAVFAIAATSASAQVMKADIPFAFRAGNTLMAPGTYTVDLKGPQPLFYLSNREAHRSAILIASGARDAAREWLAKGDPVLAFECADGRCALARLWMGDYRPAYSFPHATPAGNEHASLTLIRLVRANGD